MAEELKLESREWDEFLNKTSLRLKDMSQYLIAGANIFGFADIARHFENETGPGGTWPKRKDSTNKAYDIMGAPYSSSNKVLQLTGRLKGSLLPSAGNVRRVDRLSVELYSDVEYAHRHDMGTAGMPQREFMWLSDKAQGLMLDLVMDKLVEN